MKHIYNILFLMLIFVSAHAQINKNGLPLIKNYSAEKYKSHEQNWSVIQDNRGYMYFGNNNCILEHNGKSWRKIVISNKSIARSLAIDSSNTIYVGGVDEFGYLSPDKLGKLNYKSLSVHIDSTIKIGDVWKTYVRDSSVYFCSYDNIFVFSKNKFVKKVDLVYPSMFTFLVDDIFYVGNYKLGILKYNNDTLEEINGGDFYGNMSISSIISYSKEELLISTYGKGVFVFNTVTGISLPFLNKTASDITKKGILYYAIKLNNGDFAFSIVYNGVLITDKNGNVKYHLNEENGLGSDMPFYLYQNNGPLWTANNSGISRIDLNLPINYFNFSEELGGAINNITIFNNILYIGTDDGVYYVSNDGATPKLVKTNINTQVWKFIIFKHKKGDFLIAGTQEGVYQIRDTSDIRIIKLKNTNIANDNEHKEFLISNSTTAKNLYQTEDKPYLLIFGSKSVLTIKLGNNDKWTDFKKTKISARVSAIENGGDFLWFGTSFSGIIKAKFTDSLEIIKLYNKNIGLKNLKGNQPIEFNNNIYFLTLNGSYLLENNMIKKEGIASLDKNSSIYSYFKLRKGKIAFIIDKDNEKRKVVLYNPENNILDFISFNDLPDSRTDINILEPELNKFIIAYSDKLFYFDYTKPNLNIKIPAPNFSQVLLSKNDEPIFQGIYVSVDSSNSATEINVLKSQTDDIIPVLDYKQNGLHFVFFSPYYNKEEKIQYSYILEGNDDEWSKWSEQNFAYKNNLYEGDYTFKVKSKNIYGEISEIAQFKVKILPPWYRSIWMYILYAIVGIALIILIVYLNSRRLIKEKLQLEQIVKERTAEVVEKKSEIEAQRDEIVAQRDLVMEQKEQIEHIHEEITDSIHYAKRIQRAILPNEEHVNAAVPEHFILFKPKDIVSGDYYWSSVLKSENKINKNFIGKLVITAADCTGHGVPGAFMSMLGVSFLNEIVNEKKVDRPDLILNMMRENVISSLQQKGAEGEQKDGMDMSLCVIDIEQMKLQYSGANNPIYIIRNNNLPEVVPINEDAETKEIESDKYRLKEIKADKMPIAIYVVMNDFKLNEIDLLPGDSIYMFSDGYPDQFGGPKGKKFKYKPFKQLLLDIQELPMSEQKKILDERIEEWKSTKNINTGIEAEQIDDIVVIGIKIP